MKKERFVKLVFDQLTEEHLKKLATDIIESRLQYYIIIDHDGVVWVTYSPFPTWSGGKPRYRRNGEDFDDKELLVIEIPYYGRGETSKIEEEVETLVYTIKNKVTTAINWAVANNVPANYWD